MASFKRTIATARAKIEDAGTKAFTARLEAIEAILKGAGPRDVLTLCAHALTAVAPDCCEAHQDEFKAEFLRVLNDCIAIRQQQETAEAEADDDARPQVH